MVMNSYFDNIYKKMYYTNEECLKNERLVLCEKNKVFKNRALKSFCR